ncbi:MAG: acyl-CoA synthetase [Proteobacteria bacterium]|nr:acyl-CoA synthetase [Pseudomonadota bacterium]
MSEVWALAARLPQRPYVINLHADRYRYLRAFCAALVAGQCTLMPPNRQPHSLQQLRDAYAGAYTVGENGKESVDYWVDDEFVVPQIPDDQRAAIAFTSGSTGTPTPNLKYWRTLRIGTLSNAAMVLDRTDEQYNMVATVPPQHMWGLETSILLPLFANVAVSYLTPFYPQDIVNALNSLPQPRILVSSPIHLETLLKSGVKPDGMSKILTATAPLSKQLAIDLEAFFETRVQDIFGCSESGILATRRTSVDEEWTYSNIFDLSMTDNGVKIAAAHLSSDVILPDVVELTASNRFRWIGRQQDMVNIAGKRGSLAELNFRLRDIPGVEDGVIFVPVNREDRLAALVVAPDLNVSDILGALRSKVEPVFLPRPVVKVSQLPRQETGKLAMQAVQELFAEIQGARK